MKVHTALFARLLCMLGIGILCHSVAAATPNVSQEAQVAFSEGKWSEGRQLLNNRLRDSSISSEERSEIFSSLAHFFCEYVGDYTSGYKYYQRARALRPNEPDFKLNEIRTLESEKKVHAAYDQILFDIINRANWQMSQPSDKDAIEKLRGYLDKTPDYYRRAEAYYCIGQVEAAQHHNFSALHWFKRAKKLKPAISFFVPIDSQSTILREQFIQNTTTRVASTGFIVLTLASLILFLASKPWTWLRWKQLIAFFLSTAVLFILFLVVGSFLAEHYLQTDPIQSIISGGEKYIYTALNSPAFKMYLKLLTYMGAASIITFTFSSGTGALLKSRHRAMLINGIFGMLIMASSITLFYIRHIHTKTSTGTEFNPRSFFTLTDGLLIQVKGIEPYILTNPEAYPNPGLHKTNPPLEDWAKKHCTFDKSMDDE